MTRISVATNGRRSVIAAALSATGRLAIMTVGAWVAIVLAAGAAFASASFADVASSGTEGPSTLQAKALAVLTEQGISRAQAERALTLQQRVAETKLSSKIRAALGDEYSGVWFEPAAAKFYVGVTSNASRQAVTRFASEAGLGADVVATSVRSTLKALIAAQKEWNRRLASLLGSEDVMTAIAPDSNAVQVRLSAAVPSSERAALKYTAAKAAVNILVSVERSPKLGIVQEAKKTCEKKFTAFNAFCEEAITAGAGIRTPGSTKVDCTAGPELISGIVTYMLTSGHCIDEEETALGETPEVFEEKEVASAFPANGVFKRVGSEGKRFNNKERDMAEVLVVPRGQGGAFAERLPIPVPALVAQWTATPEKPHPVEGQEEAAVKQIICHEGAATGEQCGKVLALYVTGAGVENLVETSACSASGDSGGPYFIVEKEKLLIVGVHEGKPKEAGGCGEANPRTLFEPLVGLFGAEKFGILNTFAGESLLTTANENRAKGEKEEKELKEKEEKELKELKEKEEKEGEGNPLILPAPTAKAPLTFTATSGKSILETAEAKLECKEDTASGEFTGVREGTATLNFHGCKDTSIGISCHSLGDAAETILTSGSVELVDLEKSSKLVLGLEIAPKELHIECSVALVLIKGTAIGEISGIENGKKTKTGTAIFKQEKGKQAIKECHLTKKFCESKKFLLEASLSGGAFKEAGLETEEKLTFGKEATFDF